MNGEGGSSARRGGAGGPARTEGGAPPRRGRVLLALAAILALGGWMRHEYARTTRRVEEPLLRDEAWYHRLASSVARGRGLRMESWRRDGEALVALEGPTADTPPLWPWLLGAAYALHDAPPFAAPLRLDVFPEARRLACGDVDRDGAGDLFVVSPDGGVQLWLHRGDRRWTPSWQLQIPPGAEAFAVEDLDGDRIAELLAVHPSRGTVSIAHRRWGGGFQVEEFPAGCEAPFSLAVLDVTGDGALDVLVADPGAVEDPGAGSIALLPGDGEASLLPARVARIGGHPRALRVLEAPPPAAGEAVMTSIPPARVEGPPELLILDTDGGELRRFALAGGGAPGKGGGAPGEGAGAEDEPGERDGGLRDLGLVETVGRRALAGPVDAAGADLDGDGSPETLIACRDDPSLVVVHGSSHEEIPLPSPPLAVFTGDFDFDLRPDAAVRLAGASGTLVLYGDGRGGLEARPPAPAPAGSPPPPAPGIVPGGSLDTIGARLSADRSRDLARLLPGGRLEILPGSMRLRAAQNLQLVLGLGTIAGVFLLATTLAGSGCGLLAALLAALDPDLLGPSATMLSEPLLMLLTTAFVLLHLRARRRGTAGAWALAGAALAASLLTKAMLTYLPLFLLAEILLAHRPRRRRKVPERMPIGWPVHGGRRPARRAGLSAPRGAPTARRAALGLTAGILLVLAPWTLRNAAVLRRFVPIVDLGGYELFAANYLPPDPDVDALAAMPAVDYVASVYAQSEVARRAWLRQGDAASATREQWRAGWSNLWRYVTVYPDLLGKLLWGKFLGFWIVPERFVGPYPLGGGGGGEDSPWPRVRAWSMLAALAGLGWIGIRRGRAAFVPLVTILLYHLALTFVWLSEPRYHLHLEPLLDALAAIGLVAIAAGTLRAFRAVPWASILDWEVPGARRPPLPF